jgi:hypothetical protein
MIRWVKGMLIVAALSWAAYAIYGIYMLATAFPIFESQGFESQGSVFSELRGYAQLAALVFGPLALAVGVARLNWTRLLRRNSN